ncbi:MULTISPECIES: hypothetical protein [unclassified Nocardioides]|uniref:hypothetical protein n=1 Tax=unclassified Nocardioides TaxID=2615069 RepID=UPI00005709BD|nr:MULTISPECIES: hypothetical protein [unclassified Nocardioides]ABL80856.1 hypothetical protein Noca_1342 [Nocardioides sp. JS614]
MRRLLAVLAGATLVASALAGCGDDGATTATDPGPSESTTTSSQPADQPSEEPVSVRKTCAELYRPPAQLMPRAIEFVHGSPSAEGSAEAEQLVGALADAERHALGPLAEDIAVVGEAVDAQRAAAESGADGPRVAPFDAAANRLARHCEIYND